MSNSFTSPPTLADTGALISGQIIKTDSLSRMGDLSNYLHAHGGTSTNIAQCFDANTCVTDSTSYVDLCSWRIPIPSNDHTTIDFHVNARVTTTGSGTIQFSLTDGNSTPQGSSTITITSTSYAVATVSHSFISSTTAEYVDVVMKGKVTTGSTYDLDIQTVAARFLALSSPLSAGATAQGSDEIIPFGVSRLGANYPLSARAGVQWRNNIETFRNRKRLLLAWSGIENPSSVFGAPRGQGPKSLGIGDVQAMQLQSPLFTNGGDITIWVYVVSISGTKKIGFMGQVFEISSNGWNELTLTPNLDQMTDQSRSFGISLYKTNPSSYSESDTLIDSIDRQAVINNLPRITAFSIWSN